MARISESLKSDRGRWVQPDIINIYCPRDKNVSCVRSGCITFDNVVVTNRNPGRRATVEVVSHLDGDDESCLWIPLKDFELAVSETRAISLGMFVAPHFEVLRKRCCKFEILFGPSRRIRQRDPRLSIIHSEVINFRLVDVDDGRYALNVFHACFRNVKHDRICRLLGSEAMEKQMSIEQESQVSLGDSVEIVEPDLEDVSEHPEAAMEECVAEGEQNSSNIPIQKSGEQGSTGGPRLMQYRSWIMLLMVISILVPVAVHLVCGGLRLNSVVGKFNMVLDTAFARIARFTCRVCRMHMKRAVESKQIGIGYRET